MIDFLKVFKSSNAYKVFLNDCENNKISHAYLFVSKDRVYLDEYLKIIAKIIMCNNGHPCLHCRDCELIENKSHSDVLFYPKGEKGINTEEIVSLIEESFIKPIESDKKIFVLANAETMNLTAQNKLLKTLEEPPKNVHIILGVNSDSQLLQTIKSRVKKVEMEFLTNEVIFDALKDDYTDEDKLKQAISCGDGTLGKAKSLYGDENFYIGLSLAKDILINMKTSRDVLAFSNKIEQSKIDSEELFDDIELMLEDFLYIFDNKKELVKNELSIDAFNNSENFNRGSVIYALEKISESRIRRKFNANDKMLLEWLLFQMLEGKHKWQKL